MLYINYLCIIENKTFIEERVIMENETKESINQVESGSKSPNHLSATGMRIIRYFNSTLPI